MANKIRDLTGLKIGKLTVIDTDGVNDRGRIFDYGWDIERALTEKPVKGKNQYG